VPVERDDPEHLVSLAPAYSALLFWVIVLCLELLVIPVHVSPASGSIRCGSPPDIGVFYLPSSNWEPGLFNLCEHAEHTRRAEVATTLAGAVISTIGLGLASTWRPRRRASLISLVGFVLAFGSFLLVIGNAIE
jgi:hypothetical protein